MLEVPSPKFQVHETGVLLEASANATVWPMVGALGVTLKAATGLITMAVTGTVLLVVLEPAALRTVRVTEKVPAAE